MNNNIIFRRIDKSLRYDFDIDDTPGRGVHTYRQLYSPNGHVRVYVGIL